MPQRRKCDKCKKEVDRVKDIHKVKGIYLCNECYKENKKNHREETIETSGIKEELKELDNKISRTYQKIYYERKKDKRFLEKDIPKIKNSKEKNKQNNHCYMTQQEKQILFGMLIRRGLDYEEADLAVKSLVNFEAQLRKKLRENKESEKEIRIELENKKAQMLEELWNI